ncbi:hypothetical protein G6011_04980 [Alternaria panax]|uniref:Uncharacterized protein n=1 Tax=Alternaria panax TaxID=48097 RepID=A0AAD4I8R4_9PLEO|nr:hypothetical protein G6011_04980 [Alternaria panax]
MSPQKSETEKHKPSRKRKSNEDDDTQRPRARYRPILPAPAKLRKNPDGTVTPVAKYTPGYGPISRPQAPAAGSNPAIKREPDNSPPFARPVSKSECELAQAARDHVMHLRRTANMTCAIPLPAMMDPQPPLSHKDAGSGTPCSWNAELDDLFQNSRRIQGPLQNESPSFFDLDPSDASNNLDFSWIANITMGNPRPSANATPLQYGHDSAVQAPETSLFPDYAPGPLLCGEDGEFVDPSLLSSTPEVPKVSNNAIPVYNVEQFSNTGENSMNFDFGSLQPRMQQQQPQFPSQAQNTYVHEEDGHHQQPQSSAYINGYSPQQQQPWHMANYAYYHLQQQQAPPLFTPPYTGASLVQQTLPLYALNYTNAPMAQQQQPAYVSPYNLAPRKLQPAPKPPLGSLEYQLTYTAPTQINNVASSNVFGNNIMVNHIPSSSLSLSQTPTTSNIHIQNARRQRDLEKAKAMEERGKSYRDAKKEQ